MKKARRKISPRSASAVDRYIGVRMREQRLALEISQVQLGKKSGVSFQQMNVPLSSMFERGPTR
jgi:hypothetical protein